MKKIAILAAMRSEVEFLREMYHTSYQPSEHPLFTVYSFKENNTEIIVVSAGKDKRYGVESVGSQVMSAMTLWTIENYSPDLIINAGTAGGLNTNIGEVYHVNIVSYLDRFIPLENFINYGVYKTFISPIQEKTISLFTSNSLTTSDEELKFLKKEAGDDNIVLKDMEAAAVVQIAGWYEVELHFIKSVTDLLEAKDTTPEQFLENFKNASRNLAIELSNYLKMITK